MTRTALSSSSSDSINTYNRSGQEANTSMMEASTLNTASGMTGTPTKMKPSHSPSHSAATQAGETSRASSSQYPHCSFCLVAEFDIDKGSTLSYQYPAPIGHDSHMLAELMLPDGVHARNEDWTIFFLPAESEDNVAVRLEQQQEQQQDSNRRNINDNASTSSKGKERSRDDLFYVLNLVRTKHDNTVRRGAMVKAIAVGTRHPFIQVFKPALLLALDEYFKSSSIDVLVRLFDSLNSLDLSAMPRFTRDEKLILRASERRDLFEERFKDSPPLRTTSGLRQLTNLIDEADSRREESRSRSGSTSTTQSSYEESLAAKAVNSSTFGSSVGGRSTPHLPHKPSLASLRPSSNGSGILKRRPSAAAQIQLQQAGGLDGSHMSLPNNAMWKRQNGSGVAVSSMAALGNGKVKDTHYWDTSVSYGKIQDLPIRIPTDVFDEEVGEYSLIDLITTFSSSTPVGPQHPHLHSNGQLTPPLIILFNAIITGKRIVFLGHNQPASRVASHVLSACALGSGCGSGWRGIARRCFPYANLGTMDELEKVPGYIAGVTNPRFEDLHAWDLLLNIENGKMTIAKDLEPAPPVRSNTRINMSEAYSSNSLTSSNGVGPDGEVKLNRTTSDTDVLSSGMSSFSGGTMRGRDRAGTVLEAKVDAPENAFMDEIQQALGGRYGERYIRGRFSDWAINFIRQVARHEEHFYGQTSIAPPSQPYLNGQLGSGNIPTDREVELKEIQVNAMRIEAFRATESYKLYRHDEAARERHRTITGLDLNHQLGRLRRPKKLSTGECELIISTVARAVQTSDQVIELLALLPPQQGGLLPFSSGLFHPSLVIRAAAQDLLFRLTHHPVGKKFVQSLNLFHRLALARLLHESQEVHQALTPSGTTSTMASTSIQSATTPSTVTLSNSRDSLANTSLAPPRDGLPSLNGSSSTLPAHWSRSASPAYP